MGVPRYYKLILKTVPVNIVNWPIKSTSNCRFSLKCSNFLICHPYDKSNFLRETFLIQNLILLDIIIKEFPPACNRISSLVTTLKSGH